MLPLLLVLMLMSVPAWAQAPTGWQVQESRGPTGSITSVTLLLRAESAITTRGETVQPMLMVQCVEGRTELGVYTGPYRPSADHTQSVRYRLDRSRPVLAEWNESRGDRALFHPNPRFLLFDLAITQLLLFEFPNYEGERVLARFHTTGLDEHLPKVARACGWEDELPPHDRP